MQLLIYFFIAIGLSMDAFSLALVYGVNDIKRKKIIMISTVVGIFHFIMPTLGSVIGYSLIGKIVQRSNIIVSLVFICLSIEMFISRNEEKRVNITNYISILLFAITVSIDSLTLGIVLPLTEKNPSQAYLIFAIVSFLFTLLGLLLGKRMNKKYGKKSIYLGIFILILLSIKYLIF